MLNNFSKISLILSVISASQTMAALQDKTDYDQPNHYYRYPVSPEKQPNRRYMPVNRHLPPRRLDFSQYAPVATFEDENGLQIDRLVDSSTNAPRIIPISNLSGFSEEITDAQFIDDLSKLEM